MQLLLLFDITCKCAPRNLRSCKKFEIYFAKKKINTFWVNLITGCCVTAKLKKKRKWFWFFGHRSTWLSRDYMPIICLFWNDNNILMRFIRGAVHYRCRNFQTFAEVFTLYNTRACSRTARLVKVETASFF